MLMADGNIGKECKAMSARLTHDIRDNAFASMHSADRVAVAAQGPQAECSLEGVPDQQSSESTREIDTRLFEHENDDQPIQPCADDGREAGSSQVVRRDRLLSDRCEIETGDSEGVMRVLLSGTRFRFVLALPRSRARERQPEINIRGSASCPTPMYYIYWRRASSCVTYRLLFVASTIYFFFQEFGDRIN